MLVSTAEIVAPKIYDELREVASCHHCLDLGLWFGPTGSLVTCPAIEVGEVLHAQPNNAALAIHRSIRILRESNIMIGRLHFDIARSLTFYTTEKPCPRKQLIERNFGWTPNAVRQLHRIVEDLRRDWLLPVGTRKDDPSGYWIITDTSDFHAWVKRAKQAPITQLSTIVKVARANWPHFAEQLELEFFNDMTEGDR